MIIIGAGLAGCLAGALHPNARIFEAESQLPANHRAVLRFRDDKIAQALGIPFRRVRVHKSIVVQGRHIDRANPEVMNMYSRKVAGRAMERSIADIEPVDRFVAPSDFHEQLATKCIGRIEFGHPITSLNRDEINNLNRRDIPVISTIPMPRMLNLLGIQHHHEFKFEPIFVERWHVPDCDVHQTIYFPGDETPVYRATLTGSDLIVECAEEYPGCVDIRYVQAAFGLREVELQTCERQSQRYGKIVPIATEERKRFLLRMTMEHNVYSLGRFACWRNILLDDVYEDFFRVRRMAALGTYDLIRSQS